MAVAADVSGSMFFGLMEQRLRAASDLRTLRARDTVAGCGGVAVQHLSLSRPATRDLRCRAVHRAGPIRTLAEHLSRSLTWDKGTELARHKDITLATDLAIYVCDSHKPEQRCSNENTSGLLRQYLPKSAEPNERPRKVLGCRTPAGAFERLLYDSTQPFVATTS